MKLLSILLVLLIEHFLGSLEDLRRFHWLKSINLRLHRSCGRLTLWQGPVGVLVTLTIPLAVVALGLYALDELSGAFSFIAALLLLLYSIGPQDPREQVAAILEARRDELSGKAETLAREFVNPEAPEAVILDETAIAGAYLVNVGERLFAVLLWFMLLGPIGALLFRLSAELRLQQHENTTGFQQSARDLYAILDWLPSRLLAMTYALAGSLSPALDAWGFSGSLSLYDNRDLLRRTGLASLQFERIDPEEKDWLGGAQALALRSLWIWLTVIGILVLGGWAG